MVKKRIKNIVFYKYLDKNQQEQKVSTIFYHDGSVESVSYEEGIRFSNVLARERGIKSINAFKELINKELIHVVSKEEFDRNYYSYLAQPTIEDFITETDVKKSAETEEKPTEYTVDYPDEEPEIPIVEAQEEPVIVEVPEKEKNEEPVIIETPETEKNEEPAVVEVEEIKEEPEYDFIKAAKEKYTYNEQREKQTKKKNKKGIFKRVAAVVLALAIGTGLYSCASRKSKAGVMTNSNLSSAITSTESSLPTSAAKNNDNYNNYSTEKLLEVTTNEDQKDAMSFLSVTLNNFNKKFASSYLETGKDIKAALSFDEAVALQQAYSDFTPKQIKAYFNGTSTDSIQMTRDYKNATLQLMGAHVIETRENPVDVSWLIESQEGRDFYYRYHNLFLDAKEATGTDKLMKINDFFTAVREDFPITNEIRTEGISHADAYQEIESYKLAVTPMIAAAEMMFQNLESDLTLNDSEIDFINDLGLCDYASKKFEKIERITMDYKEDKTNPKYEQFKTTVIKELKENDSYVVNDTRRDLSRLDAFQSAVNWHFEIVEEDFTGVVSYGSVTTYTTKEESVSKPIPADKKAEIDAQIAQENTNARRTGEANAQKTQQDRQAQEDENARRIEEEVERDNANLQNQINNANTKINNNEQVNESDFGGHVTFDDGYKDNNGNLDNSVENITTDSTGDKTNDPLPDPNAMGADFESGRTFSIDSEEITDEELVDAYINSLAEAEYESEGAYVYHK